MKNKEKIGQGTIDLLWTALMIETAFQPRTPDKYCLTQPKRTRVIQKGGINRVKSNAIVLVKRT